mmetsp:Transcript_98057/g.256004  ORF Transcript_98057/g.256004 Transcript_98057/m.256004 type:complete len:216 (+) Transcript_98057:3-650(+)
MEFARSSIAHSTKFEGTLANLEGRPSLHRSWTSKAAREHSMAASRPAHPQATSLLLSFSMRLFCSRSARSREVSWKFSLSSSAFFSVMTACMFACFRFRASVSMSARLRWPMARSFSCSILLASTSRTSTKVWMVAPNSWILSVKTLHCSSSCSVCLYLSFGNTRILLSSSKEMSMSASGMAAQVAQDGLARGLPTFSSVWPTCGGRQVSLLGRA